MNNQSSRLPAILAYLLPVIGWLYVFFFQRKNSLAMYHLRQSIGLILFLAAMAVGWAVIGWVLAWIPYLGIFSIALFSIVIVAYLYGSVAWIMGLINAFRARQTPLPLFGQWASRLPIR
jgi:uncharacterized membrane protein